MKSESAESCGRCDGAQFLVGTVFGMHGITEIYHAEPMQSSGRGIPGQNTATEVEVDYNSPFWNLFAIFVQI